MTVKEMRLVAATRRAFLLQKRLIGSSARSSGISGQDFETRKLLIMLEGAAVHKRFVFWTEAASPS